MNRKTINISLFIITAVIISFIVPTYSTFNYKFELGQTWKSEDISASLDFPIAKTLKEYETDVENYLVNYIPIYELDTLVTKKILNGIISQYDIGTSDDKTATLNGLIIYNTMEDILSIGIIDSVGNRTGKNIIKLISNGSIEPRSIRNLYTYDTALEKIVKELNRSSNPTALELLELNDLVYSNVIYNNSINIINEQKEVDKISKTKGFIPKGSVILTNGEKIDAKKLNILDSYRDEIYTKGSTGLSLLSYFGYLMYVVIIMILSYFSLKNFRADVMDKLKNVLFLLLLYIVSISVMAIVTKHSSLNIYIFPFIIIPLYISAFYSTKMSVSQYMYLLLIASVMAPKPIEFILINFLGGVVAILVMQSSYRRHIILQASLCALLTYITIYASLCLMTGDYASFSQNLIGFGINSVLVIILYQFLFVIEKTFNFVTNITLFDLCDTNRPLLRDMAIKAPGTFQHAIQVANISESAAKSIGANHLLARTGALYHDIGKMLNPEMFIENSIANNQAHINLTAKQSAEIIKNHVVNGTTLAKKHNLPKVVVEFIESHHSDSLIYFFYRKELDEVGIENIDETDFRYPGPKPVSKEASICLIVDGIEAASRSMEVYTEQSISDLIQNIISNQINDGLLSDSALEIKDIQLIKESIRQSLMNVYHSRIAYPKR